MVEMARGLEGLGDSVLVEELALDPGPPIEEGLLGVGAGPSPQTASPQRLLPSVSGVRVTVMTHSR